MVTLALFVFPPKQRRPSSAPHRHKGTQRPLGPPAAQVKRQKALSRTKARRATPSLLLHALPSPHGAARPRTVVSPSLQGLTATVVASYTLDDTNDDITAADRHLIRL
ncbi:hypothetical protein EDB89DRAFT_2068430 [Lactarius sanguifluus]|nr:hypothetical protein EDB89DRAFT_2079218 [Lactarius sanguifluus]KAH9173893.1 hypothetical protein EDB89DRAFT_2068430 [Lactarius sanguifluus]